LQHDLVLGQKGGGLQITALEEPLIEIEKGSMGRQLGGVFAGLDVATVGIGSLSSRLLSQEALHSHMVMVQVG